MSALYMYRTRSLSEFHRLLDTLVTSRAAKSTLVIKKPWVRVSSQVLPCAYCPMASPAMGHWPGRPHIGANGVSWPPLEKWIKKLKSENTQKEQFLYFCAHNYVYVIFWEQSGQAGVENGAMLTTFRYTLYFRMHHFVVKFLKIYTP